MLRKHSSESEDVPLYSYKARNRLHKPDSLPCEFCDHVSTSIYANFKHNATHIIIPLVNLTLHQCEDCLHHFTSLEELTTHAKLKNHTTSQVVLKSQYDLILQSIIKKQLVVKCYDLFKDIKENSGISQNSTKGSEETDPDTDNTVTEANITDTVVVKSEFPTYVVSDSDSNGRDSPFSDIEGLSTNNEQTHRKVEVFQPKSEHKTLPETVIENLPGGNGEQSPLLVRSDSPLRRKWEHYSDSDSHSDIKAEQSLPVYTEGSVSPLHNKIQHSDSDTDIEADVNENSKMKFYHSDEEITEVDQSVFKLTLERNSIAKRKISSHHEPITSRLVFEDDLDDDFAEEILPDIACRALPNTLVGTTPRRNFKPNSVILGSKTNGIMVKDMFFGNGHAGNVDNLKISDSRVEEKVLKVYPESVPYETLVKTQICDCRFCGRCFCNRMQLISHETTHLRIRKPRPTLCVHCERFYPGNYRALKKHVEAKHPEVDPDEKRPQTQICKICHLNYYNLSRHNKLYHSQKEENSQQPVFNKYRYRTMKVCDMCLHWVKNDHIYKHIGSHSEVGRTQKCCKCMNRHFSINLVTRRHFGYNKVDGNIGRSISNEERLMRIKKKLKLIKQMNKCFCSCFI